MEYYQTILYGALCTPCLYGENTAKLKSILGHTNPSCYPGCISYAAVSIASSISGAAVSKVCGCAASIAPTFSELCTACTIGHIAGENRKEIRKVTGLPPTQDWCDDCAIHAFCSPCAVCEEAIALDKFEKTIIEYNSIPSAPSLQTMEI